MRISEEARQQIARCQNSHFKRTMKLVEKGKMFERYECPDCPYFELTNNGFIQARQ